MVKVTNKSIADIIDRNVKGSLITLLAGESKSFDDDVAEILLDVYGFLSGVKEETGEVFVPNPSNLVPIPKDLEAEADVEEEVKVEKRTRRSKKEEIKEEEDGTDSEPDTAV